MKNPDQMDGWATGKRPNLTTWVVLAIQSQPKSKMSKSVNDTYELQNERSGDTEDKT